MTDNNRSVLIVDDEPSMLAGLSRILGLDGYDVVSAETAQELLARTNSSEYFAIILDRRLPDGTADQLLPKLKELAPQVPVLAT